MDYYQYQVNCPSNKIEILIALFSQFPFDSFQENDKGFDAYIPSNLHTNDLIKDLIQIKQVTDFQINSHFIPDQNWNKRWESNFKAIHVGKFCTIRADFHPKNPSSTHDIVINPKMAFGTGHHATTYMMIDFMQDMELQHKSVWDYGCGTGILAILASKLGAKKIIANDIEKASFENTVENAAINEISNIHTFEGDQSIIKEAKFDIILANINRNVILDSLSTLYKKLPKGGQILISGFLKEDEKIMKAAVLAQNFTLIQQKERDNWLCWWLTA